MNQATPEWWLATLNKRLEDRRPHIDRMWRYYDGEHSLAFASQKFLDAFGGMFSAFADNWCDLVVDAVEERLNVEGFRLGTDTAGDDEAWRIWQANGLDAESQLAHTEALVTGEAYATAWYGPDDRLPVLTVEPSTNAIVDHDPANRRVRRAGLRRYDDDWGWTHVELFLPDRVWLFKAKSGDGTSISTKAWKPDLDAARGAVEDGNGAWIENPLGEVPMVALTNRPRLRRHRRFDIAAQSEIAQVIPLQDAVNKLVADLMVDSESHAMPQRYALGLDELPTDPVTGQPYNPYTPDKKMWLGEGDMSRAVVGQFDAGDLTRLVKAIEMVVQHIASQTRTPPHYLNASADRLSGESIKAAETGLVAKTRRKQRHFGEGWEDFVHLGLRIIGDDRGNRTDSEVIWGDPESRTESEHVDALVKKKQLGVPNQQLQEDAGYSPQQIARFAGMAAQEALAQRMGGGALTAKELADTIQSIYLGVDKVITAEEGRSILNRAGADLSGPGPQPVDV